MQRLVHPCIPVSTRVRRKDVTITLSPELVLKSKALGLNISKIAESALSRAVSKLEQPLSPKLSGPGGIRTRDY